MKRALVVVIAACSSPQALQPPPTPVPAGPAMLAALPKPIPTDTKKFASVVVCDRCHTAGATAMRDGKGTDISPVTEVQAGMMSLSARDPYYLAALRREIAANPGAQVAIEKICNRCHAPVGFAEAGAISLADLTSGTSPAAALAREGVGCAGCHALDPAGLGGEESFVGLAALRTDRVSFGALPEPLVDAMVTMSNTRPVPSPHVSQSRLCASCHTVLVHRLDDKGAPTGDEVPEQTTFLEWRNSIHAADGGETCQDCHMPKTADEQGRGDTLPPTPFATRPPDAPPRIGYRRHTLRGGNSYLLRRMADHAPWLNAATRPELLRAAADATDVFLGRSAKLDIAGTRDAMRVVVFNATGHKLPTGYPTRRMWLHVIAKDAAGKVVFESGRHRDGAIVDGAGKRLDGPGVILPHVTTITSERDVAIWEAVPVDAAGKRTHLLLGTAKIVKDSRILPTGWRSDHPDARRTKAIGVDGDGDFVAGRDTVTVRLPATTASIAVELLYQPIPPETIESYKPTDSPEAARFLDIAAKPPMPSVLATASKTL